MRIHGNLERGIANLTAGRERARQERVAFRGPAVRPPDRGALLWTLRITDELRGVSSVLELRQGPRRNNLFACWLGSAPRPTGADALVRSLRRRLKARWLVIN